MRKAPNDQAKAFNEQPPSPWQPRTCTATARAPTNIHMALGTTAQAMRSTTSCTQRAQAQDAQLRARTCIRAHLDRLQLGWQQSHTPKPTQLPSWERFRGQRAENSLPDRGVFLAEKNPDRGPENPFQVLCLMGEKPKRA